MPADVACSRWLPCSLVANLARRPSMPRDGAPASAEPCRAGRLAGAVVAMVPATTLDSSWRKPPRPRHPSWPWSSPTIPGPWFDEVVNSLAVQDYPNLRVLFLDAGEQGDLAERIGDRVPGRLRAPPRGPGRLRRRPPTRCCGWSRARASSACSHDDVALDADAIRQLVEETYRSNAGVVGPKLVDWDAPEHLLEVGSAADKFGTPAPLVDAGRARPGAARRRPRRVLRAVGLHPRPHRPVPRPGRLRRADAVLRRRPRPVLARPRRRRARAGRARGAGPPPRLAWPSVIRASTRPG